MYRDPAVEHVICVFRRRKAVMRRTKKMMRRRRRRSHPTVLKLQARTSLKKVAGKVLKEQKVD